MLTSLRAVNINKKVIIAGVATVFSLIWKTIGVIGDIDFLIQKLGLQENIYIILTSPKTANFAVFFSFALLIFFLFLRFRKQLSVNNNKKSNQMVEILWDKTSTKYLKNLNPHIDEYYPYRIYVGVKNLSDKPVQNLRVLAEEIATGQTILGNKVLLREMNDIYPYQKTYILNPKSELLFYLGECDSNRVLKIFSAVSGDESIKIPPYHGRVQILVEANDIIPVSKNIDFMWKHEGLVSP